MDDVKLNAHPASALFNGWHDEPAKSLSMHKNAYIDPQWLKVDQTEIFHKSWQFLCHEEQLRDNGSYVTMNIQGQSIVAIRDRKGELRGFYNVCKHRGHELLKGSGTTKRVICPYHAWSYDLDGTFLEARQSQFIENFNNADFCLDQVQVEVFCHMVFVNLDPKAAPLAQQSGDLSKEIMSFAPDLGKLTFSHRLTYNIKANWKSVVDNFLECYHCPVAHRDFCTLIEMDTYKVTTHGIYSSHMAKAGRSDNNAYSTDGAEVTDHAVWYLWPNTTLMRYPGSGNFMVWRFYPVGPEETYEEFDFFFENTAPSDEEVEAIKFVDDVLQPEDIDLVESVQRGMQTPAYQQGRYMVDPDGSGLSEHAVHHFHSLVRQSYLGS
ncbi:MAG: ring-hydroxylating oxygenase subunit alpha [Alphaproteobacteria bacterium]|nr:ring-hydroxylating oxygenase subunit alpha [Alphaproteobacteria bacterium]